MQRSYVSVTVGNKKTDHAFKKDKVASFATSVSLHESTVRKAGCQNSCQLCQHDHDLEECEAFLGKSVDDRRVFLKENRMCFGCFAHGHISKGWLHKRRCKTCAKLHPTTLHVDSCKGRDEGQVADVTVHTTAVSQYRLPVPTESTTGTSSTPSSGDSAVFQGIIPVRVRQKGSDVCVNTYGFYDNGSTGCFISEKLCDQLQVSGAPTRLLMKTMNGCSRSDGTVVRDLVVTDSEGQNAVELPDVFAYKEIPANARQIATEESIVRWPHLDRISSQLPKFDPGSHIGILVGNNCP